MHHFALYSACLVIMGFCSIKLYSINNYYIKSDKIVINEFPGKTNEFFRLTKNGKLNEGVLS